MELAFYPLSDEIAEDENLIKEIVDLKNKLALRNTKLAVVLIPEHDSPSAADRIYHLRKSTGLQPRTGLFLLPVDSDEKEREALVESLCQLAYGRGLEIYTNIAKNIRKKRSRSNVLSSSVADEEINQLPLSSAGWEVRYNFKLAVLAEFRQDLDFSLHCYETAYDSILELFEALSPINESDKTPWVQARLLLDAVAFRIIRLCFYQGQANAAFRKFEIHLSSTTGIIEQKGLSRDSWQHVVWLAQQYRLLGQLVDLSDNSLIPDSASLAPAPDDNTPGIRLPRSGFLYLESVELFQGVSRLVKSEDPYMDGDLDVDEHITDLLAAAVKDFSLETSQKRTMCYAHYQIAESLFEKKDYVRALNNYKSAALIYKQEGWFSLLRPLLERIKECATEASFLEDVYKAEIELGFLEGDLDIDNIPKLGEDQLDIHGQDVNILQYGFVFEGSDCYCGVETRSQLYLKSKATVKIDRVMLEFEDGYHISIENDTGDGESANKLFFDLKGERQSSVFKCNLNFQQGIPRIFQLHHHPDQIGTISLTKVTADISTDAFKFSSNVSSIDPLYKNQSLPWFTETSSKQRKTRSTPHKVTVLPRPSRLVVTQNAKHSVAPGENVTVNVEVLNQEDDDVLVNITANTAIVEGQNVEHNWEGDLEQVKIEVSKTHTFTMHLKIPNELSGSASLNLELCVTYSLVNDEETKIKDSSSHMIQISRPFRIDFDVAALLQPEDWPSMFTSDAMSISPVIKKRWDLGANILFIGEGEVQVLSSELEILSDENGFCKLVPELSLQTKQSIMVRNDRHKNRFVIDCWRKGNRELRSIVAEARLNIKWKRTKDGPVNSLISSPVRLDLPLYEPRVILSLQKEDSELLKIKATYYIENATSHILTYSVSMSSSPAFAYQGSKLQSVRLLPYSRRLLQYIMIPRDKTNRMVLPHLKVHDTYYKRILTVTPASRDIYQDKDELYVLE